MSNYCQIQWLGSTTYESILRLQRKLVVQRTADEIPDTLLLSEHPSTYSFGIDAHREHLLLDEQELAQHNIACHTVDRSGSVVHHCPGQLVVYPILKLTKSCYNYHTYIEMLENVILRTLASFQVRGLRQPGQRGIWVFSGSYDEMGYQESMAKIGSVEVKVNRDSITSHNFWINIAPDLHYFDLIVPSGVQAGAITSLRRVLNKPIEINDAIRPVIQSFCNVFQTDPITVEKISLLNHQPARREPVTI